MAQNGRIKDGEASLRSVAPGVLTARFDAMMTHAAGTRAGSDPEALHDMRVASRRLRAALDAFGPCYDGHQFRRVVRETKALTRALGAVRDDDVLLDSFHAYRDRVPEDEQAALTRFIASLAVTRDTHRTGLLRHLDALDADDYVDRFHHAVAKPAK